MTIRIQRSEVKLNRCDRHNAERCNAYGCERTRTRKARVHFFLKAETVLDNLAKRVGAVDDSEDPKPRDYRAVLKAALALAFPLSDVTAAAAAARWSKHAGCTSCPCSPGFIIDHVSARGFDVFVDVAVQQ